MNFSEFMARPDAPSQTEVGIWLGMSQGMVWQMINGHRPVPLEHCPRLERYSDGLMTCEELRPDKLDYWAELREIFAAQKSPIPQTEPAAALQEVG